MQDLFDLRCQINTDPQAGTPLVVPLSRASRAEADGNPPQQQPDGRWTVVA